MRNNRQRSNNNNNHHHQNRSTNNNNNNNNNRSNCSSNNNNNNNRKTNQNKGNKYCSIHGQFNHSSNECDIIKREQSSYNDKKSDAPRNTQRNNNNNTRNNNGNYRNQYNNRRNEKNNQIHHRPTRINQNNNSNNSCRSHNSTNTYPNSDDEINHINDIYTISDPPNTPNNKDKGLCTETKVQVRSTVDKSSMLLGLLDTGASATYISAAALTKIKHTVEPINVQLRGRYSTTRATKIATFDIQLPDFCSSKTGTLRAYVEKAPIGIHDIVMGTRVCQQLGLIFDFKRQVVHWDNLSMTMKLRGTYHKETLNSIDDDQELPTFMQQATLRLTKGISPNTYNKHDYKDMVLRCQHLTTEEQDSLIHLFGKYRELFSGTLGLVPGPPVHLK